MMTTTTPVKAEARNLSFFYNGGHNAVKNVSMPLYENKITALIGPSGCGKSTFLRCFNRMHDLYPGNKYDGQIIMHPDNTNILEKNVDPIEVRMRISMVFQKPNPFPMSIYENVIYGPKCQGLIDKKKLDKLVEDSLKKAALWEEVKDRLNDSALALSGGQQQRLCIARTIAMQPSVILMDEPTSALDPISTQKIEELMKSLKDEYTIIIVTHSMQQAARISDYTSFFMLGEIVEYDTTDNIFSKPEKKQTEDYVTGRFG